MIRTCEIPVAKIARKARVKLDRIKNYMHWRGKITPEERNKIKTYICTVCENCIDLVNNQSL